MYENNSLLFSVSGTDVKRGAESAIHQESALRGAPNNIFEKCIGSKKFSSQNLHLATAFKGDPQMRFKNIFKFEKYVRPHNENACRLYRYIEKVQTEKS